MANTPSTSQSKQNGAEVELEVSTVAHGGVFVARHEGRVVFVADAIDGERVLATITDTAHERFWRADTVRVIESSAHRVPHVWDAAAIDRAPHTRAGGAEFGHIELAYQRELKTRVLTEALARMAGVDRELVVQAVDGDDGVNGLGWRTRVRLQVNADGALGPFAARSHTVVPVRDLPLATAAVAQAARLDSRLPGAASVDLVAPSTGDAQALVSRVRKHGGRAPRRAAGSEIVERVGDYEFRLAATGFWQVHRAAPRTLFAAVQRAIDAETFDPDAANLDLYGGVGLLAVAALDRFGGATRITTLEADRVATAFAADNLSAWSGASAVTGRVDRYLRDLVEHADGGERVKLAAGTFILDPPRSGAGKDVVETIAELHPAQIVYVACDPIALARDVAQLATRGYELRALEAFDLFPHTHHIEAVARFAPV